MFGRELCRRFHRQVVGPLLEDEPHAALAATRWPDREAALCAAAGEVAAATNRLALAEPVDPTPRRFHGRDIRVLDAGRFTDALTRAITDPQVGELVDALGRRADGTVACLPGAIDQAVDTVDILTHPARCRAAAPALGAVAVD